MLLNFCTNASEHGNRLEQVFRSFEADGKTLVFSASTDEHLEVPISFKLFSPLLREIIASQTLSTDNQTLIILPDCSPTSIKHLINLLSHGSTQTSTEEDVETIRKVAKMLGIDLKNLSYDDFTKTGLIKVDIEEGEIQDDEYFEDNVTEDMDKDDLKTLLVKSQIRIASFATADIAIPNVVQNQCLQSEKDFPSKSELVGPPLRYRGKPKGNMHQGPLSQPLLGLINSYNPSDFELRPNNARFFVEKSYSIYNIHQSIKYEIWCSTEDGNRRLHRAFMEREGPVYLFFSVSRSGHFCGMAQMLSGVDYQASSGVWAQDKWKGQFGVKWIFVKDVPNSQLRHIRLENFKNNPITNSMDTQEVPTEKGQQVLKIMHRYKHSTSIFDADANCKSLKNRPH